ncbi:MAG: sugar ABC transporter permease [Bacillota bacterium]
MAVKPSTVSWPVKMKYARWVSDDSPLVPFLFIAPYLAFFIVFTVYPIIQGMVIAFSDYDLIAESSRFIGLANFEAIFDPQNLFVKSLTNTVKYVVFGVPVFVVVGFIIALVMNSDIPGRIVFRSVFAMPFVINVAAMSLMFLWMFDSRVGIINYYFMKLGLPPQEWLSHPTSALGVIIFVSLWWGLGGVYLPFLAALQDIPQEYYEAAAIDGANSLQSFRYITIPCLKPTMLFVTVTQVIAGFQVFGQVLLITGGGPANSTRVVLQHIYDSGFQFFRLGEASAMAWILFLILMGITVTQFRLMQR